MRTPQNDFTAAPFEVGGGANLKTLPGPTQTPSGDCDLRAEGERKYPRSHLLLTSADRNWATIVAELREHEPGSIVSATQGSVEIVMALSGSQDGRVIRTGGGKFQETRATTGTIWLVPTDAGPEEIIITAAGMKTLHLYLAPRQFDELAVQFGLSRSQAHSIEYVGGLHDQVIRQIGKSILVELRHETATSRMFAESSANLLAARLIHGYAKEHSVGQRAGEPYQLDMVRLQRVLDYIERHFEEDITVMRLAEVANLSPFHFTRMFTAAVGLPPFRYVSRRRLQGAMATLATGRLPISEIAFRAGFSSQASFNRAFRRATGVTPGEFRRRAL